MSQPNIPLLDLSPEIETLWDEINAAIQDVLRSGQFIRGPIVKEFEQAAADYLGVKHAIGMNSGTDALIIGLRALGIKAGDEVITTPFTFFATGEAISLIGATPIFVDIDLRTYNLDVNQIEAHITKKTKAIIPVHLYGQAVDMKPLMELAEQYNLKVLEDVAQAFGATYEGHKVGSIGHASAYSFFPSKTLGAYGDAGMLTTNDDDVAHMARMLGAHGAAKKYHNEVLGYNSRLDSIQAAILKVKLQYIDEFNRGRQRVAKTYNRLLADAPGIELPQVADGVEHVYHQYTIRLTNTNRDAVRETLKEAGIATMVYYPIPVHQLPVYTEMDVRLPLAERAAKEVMSLPIWSQMTDDVQVRVVDTLKTVLKQPVH